MDDQTTLPVESEVPVQENVIPPPLAEEGFAFTSEVELERLLGSNKLVLPKADIVLNGKSYTQYTSTLGVTYLR